MSDTKDTIAEPEVVKNGICDMCMPRCPTKIHVRNGKAVQIDIANDNVAHCPRWKTQLDFVYHPDRLQYPMKRIGERGTGSFKRISWDEALDTTAANLQKAKDKYGAESVVFWVAFIWLAQLLHREQPMLLRHLGSRRADLRSGL